MKTLLILWMLLLGVTVSALAQSGAIIGTVLDDQNEPVIGAIVEVTAGGKTKGKTCTDIDGTYTVKPLNAGRYDVKVSYIGYKPAITTGVIVSPNKKTEVNIKLEIIANALLEVSVVAYKIPLVDKYNPGTSTTLTSEQIERMPTRSTNSLAATSAGIQQSTNGSLSIMGARTEGTVYYIDGVQVLAGDESYKKEAENAFKLTTTDPLSTMSIDVDRASYSNVRRFLNAGQMPPADAVRVEEMINYFDYSYPQPKGEDPLNIVTQLTVCPWQLNHKLLHIGMQARNIDEENLPASNIVFLIDVSGSMSYENKLPLAKKALTMLTRKLRPQDKIAIVVYAGSAGMVLPSTPGNRKETIYAALENLQAGGSTAGGEGIQLAYKIAEENFVRNGNNRVVLATDGDFNVGASSDGEMEKLITNEREKGIYLTCLGFGMGNYKDSKMEILADKGNGNYAYIDNEQEAEKTLVKEFGGTIFTLAKDVKTQIEFNPALVQSYRLVGYENRLLNNEDFKDDKKDAGEMGSGHSVTIIYEIVPAGINTGNPQPEPLKYQTGQSTGSNELATIKFRYKRPNGNKSAEIAHVITNETTPFDKASTDARFATSVAMFGMLLSNSQHKGNSSYKEVLAIARKSKGTDKEGYRSEFVDLVKQAGRSFAANEPAETTQNKWYTEEAE